MTSPARPLVPLVAGVIVVALFVAAAASPQDQSGDGTESKAHESDGQSAYDRGYDDGYQDGYNAGHADGYQEGRDDGFEAGYDEGYQDGFEDGANRGVPGPATPHPAQACSAPYHVQGAGWDLCWQQDDLRAQGLEVNRAFFHNRSVAWKMGVPFSLTKYDHETRESPFVFAPPPFKDTLGTPDEAGLPGFGRGRLAIDPDACPRFFGSGELRNNGRLCVEYRDGPSKALALWARYDAFNYRFMQGWILDDRGTIEPFLALGGILIDGAGAGSLGLNHFHHIYWRLDLDIGEGGGDAFHAFHRAAGEANPLSKGFTTILPLEELKREAKNLVADVAGCRDVGDVAGALWCTVPQESKHVRDHATNEKWRVADPSDPNKRTHARSFEFVVHSDGPADLFSSFDALSVQHKGDSEEIGHEVPSFPEQGDEALDEYLTPPEQVTDPVVWLVHHTYHDTRDEDAGTMSLHYASFTLRPNNFLEANPGEATFP